MLAKQILSVVFQLRARLRALFKPISLFCTIYLKRYINPIKGDVSVSMRG
jgi:hypothetical protein